MKLEKLILEVQKDEHFLSMVEDEFCYTFIFNKMIYMHTFRKLRRANFFVFETGKAQLTLIIYKH